MADWFPRSVARGDRSPLRKMETLSSSGSGPRPLTDRGRSGVQHKLAGDLFGRYH